MATFDTNYVTSDILPELTDSGLIQLGVVNVGWRLLFCRPISRLDSQDNLNFHLDPSQQNQDHLDYHQDNKPGQQNNQATTENILEHQTTFNKQTTLNNQMLKKHQKIKLLSMQLQRKLEESHTPSQWFLHVQ